MLLDPVEIECLIPKYQGTMWPELPILSRVLLESSSHKSGRSAVINHKIEDVHLVSKASRLYNYVTQIARSSTDVLWMPLPQHTPVAI